MWSDKDLGFILYNNRSINGVVKNFIEFNINPISLIKLEEELDKSKSLYVNDHKMVEINKSELNLKCKDIVVKKEDIESLTDLILENKGNFTPNEYEFLSNRGIGEETIWKWSILGLSSIVEKRHLEILGATCHPILNKILSDGIENGGIMIPLFQNGKLVNCAIRKINSSKSLKYSLACPDIPVWGLDDLQSGDEIWITEGLFDMMALQKMGVKGVSCSSAMWSGIQLYRLLEKGPGRINIFSDNDEVGIRTSLVLKDFFSKRGIECKILISKFAKDPAEHYFQKERNFTDLIEIENPDNFLQNKEDQSFDFLKHLKNRQY